MEEEEGLEKMPLLARQMRLAMVVVVQLVAPEAVAGRGVQQALEGLEATP